MACTSQSAREYVISARRHLVTHLRNVLVIVENLSQEGVFHEEEVKTIHAEKTEFDKARMILDLVKKKGEEACYRFLRVIDRTWKRTSGRGSAHSETTTEASSETQKFDLSYWISCYPFREEDENYEGCLLGPRSCHHYQAKLKTRARKKSSEFWMRNKKLLDESYNPDLCYSPLVLDTQGRESPSKIKKLKSKKSQMSRRKKLKTYIPVDKPNISPNDLLKTDRNILLVGKPGIGKTALCHEILKLWAEREKKELDYMFYFDMRETSYFTERMSLEELLFRAYSEPDEGTEEVLEDIKKNSDNVTLVFDGITDFSSSLVKSVVQKDLLPSAKVILTCRPDDEDDFFSGDFLRVEVKGFSEQTIKNYFSVILGKDHEKVLCRLELFSLCHVPMYALMVAACFLSKTSEGSSQPCSMTEIYINIVRFCLQRSSNKKNRFLNSFIREKKDKILLLAELAFNATKRRTVNLTDLPCEDSCVLSFLKPLVVKVAPTETRTTYAFLHYTVQEFFAALWLLKNPNQIKDVFQQCLTEEGKHMKHLIPFMCRLLTEKSPSLLEHLVPAQELKSTSSCIFKDMMSTFYPVCTEDSGPGVDLLFLCQCLYESQCPAACVYFLETLDYHLDLSGESLDPCLCCAVADVVTMSKERKVGLNLEDVSVSEQGMKRLIGCLDNVLWCDPLPQQLWKIVLLSEGQLNDASLLSFDGNQLHLPLQGKRELFERAANIIQKNPVKVNVCLHWDSRAMTICPSLSESLLKALPCIGSLSFRMTDAGPGLEDREQMNKKQEETKKELVLDLCLKAALHKDQSVQDLLQRLRSLLSVWNEQEFIFDLYQHIKSKGCLSVIPEFRRKALLKSTPSVWIIDLSKNKTSILLEVLKLQPEKKPVKLLDCSYEESEVRTFLQCLPYISQLSFSDLSKNGVKFCGRLFCAAAERDHQTGENTLELLSSLCTYQEFPSKDLVDVFDCFDQCSFLLDLFSYIKDFETRTNLRVLPSLQSVLKSTPSVWMINLSKTKTSILLEVLKLQPEKKPVKLLDCSDEESEVRTFLQCLPYISQLRFSARSENGVKFCGRLFCAAAERDHQTGENTLELLSSLCTYQEFPSEDLYDDVFKLARCNFLLDLFSYIKDYETTTTNLRVLPALQSVLKSTPSVWIIDLSKTKTSILLEVLRLQPEKKPVELWDCSYEESEVRTFLQCLPYISQLRFSARSENGVKFCGRLFCAAAERDHQTGENTLELLSSLCTHREFPSKGRYGDSLMLYRCNFLLDLFSYIKDYETTTTNLRVLPALQSVLKSTPSVWIIDLSKTETSILLEVLKLQPEKKPVELLDCSYEESEVRTFLPCLPYISQLSFSDLSENEVKLCGRLFCAAAERDHLTGENTLELLSSLCTYQEFPSEDLYDDDGLYQCNFLLDLFSYIKDYETTTTNLRVLPALQSVLKSTPSVWIMDLSKTKTSILLEVLRLQPEKKPVELWDCSYEESEVRTFLQCLPYISQLSCHPEFFQAVCSSMSVRSREEAEHLVSLLQLLGFTLTLTGELTSKTCKSVGRVLSLCGSKVDLILTPTKISVKGASFLFRHTTSLHSLRLSSDMVLVLCGWVRRKRVNLLSVIEELSVSSQKHRPSERVMLRVVSSLASLLRYCTVSQLDLTESRIPAQSLIPLLLHDGPLTIRLSGEVSQSLLAILCEIQDQDLTRSYLSKVGGDLTPVCLNWDLLHHFLQSSPQTVTVNLRKNSFLQKGFTRLLPFLDRVLFQRLPPCFVLTAIREIYTTRASSVIPSLLRSFAHEISLTCREMDSEDCAALLYTLRYSDGAKLSLMWTSIPPEEIKSILFMLDRVSELSVDRDLLLRIVHCCAASAAPQERAASLLRSLQHRLDLSCSSHVKLSAGGQTETLCLSVSDCRAISIVLRYSSQDTELQLQDCEVEDSGLDLLFSVLDRVKLRASKDVLLQMVSLVSERDPVSRAMSLYQALGGELVLSHTKLDQTACEALALMLDYSEDLTELDLSYCSLTDQLLGTLKYLHKVHILDLSHNKITDESTSMLLRLVNTNPSIETVRLFGNNIVSRAPFKTLQTFEIW